MASSDLKLQLFLEVRIFPPNHPKGLHSNEANPEYFCLTMSNSWDLRVLRLIMDGTACKRKTNSSESGCRFSSKLSNTYEKPRE